MGDFQLFQFTIGYSLPFFVFCVTDSFMDNMHAKQIQIVSYFFHIFDSDPILKTRCCTKAVQVS